MSDLKTIANAVTTLEYHDEDEIADQLREYMTGQRGIGNRVQFALQKAMLWFIIFGTVGTVVYGFVESLLSGDWLAALGIMLFGVFIYGALAVLHHYAEGAYDWFAGQVEGDR